MIQDTDNTLLERQEKFTNLLWDLQVATIIAMDEIKPEYRHGTIQPWLNFNIKGRNARVTPLLKIDTHQDEVTCRLTNAAQIKFDVMEVYHQVDERLKRERLTWDMVAIDKYKYHVNDGYIAL